MSKSRTIIVAVADLQTNLFVRESLDQDRVLFLGELHESGVKLDPIMICAKNKEIVDGRHRKEMYEILGIKEIQAKVVDIDSDIDMISMAYKANSGGAKPPTQADTEHTIQSLLGCGATKKSIASLIGLPPSFARKLVNSVESRVKHANLNQAANAIAENNMTVAHAAEKFGVDVEQLKSMVSGSKRNRKKSGVEEMRRNLTRMYRSLGGKHASMLRSLLEKLSDGDVAPKFVAEVFSHIQDLQVRQIRTVCDWKKRFDAMVNGDDKKDDKKK